MGVSFGDSAQTEGLSTGVCGEVAWIAFSVGCFSELLFVPTDMGSTLGVCTVFKTLSAFS